MSWERKPLGEITRNLDSRRIPLNLEQRNEVRGNSSYPYFGANGLVDRIDDFIFDEKILCVAEDGGSWGKNEKCAYVVDEKCWVNNHAHVMAAKDGVSLEYLKYFLNHSDLNGYITGTTRGKLTRSALDRIVVPLPPLEEQRRIAEVLDRADALRQKRRLALQKLDTLLQSVFLDMFGDPAFNPKRWPKVPLSEIAAITAPFVDPTKDQYGSMLHYGPDRIERNTGNLLPAKTAAEDGLTSGKFLFDAEAILYSKIRPNLNKVALAVEPGLCSADMYPINVNKERVAREFLWCILRSDDFLGYAAAYSNRANIPKINRDQLFKYTVILPPMDKQEAFVIALGATLKAKGSFGAFAGETNRLFNALQTWAFSDVNLDAH